MCRNIDWSELIDLDEKIEWSREESFDYRDIDSDWPYAESEDYYQENNDYAQLISWTPPRKPKYKKKTLDFKDISKEDFCALCKDSTCEYYFGYGDDLSYIYPLKEIENHEETAPDLYIFAFPKRYILPTRSSFESWYPLSVFYTIPEGEKRGKYAEQFIIAKNINDRFYRNDYYCKLDNTEAREYLEECYHRTLKSHAEHIQEMVYAEPSSNRRIFGIDAQSAFLKSAKEIHGECAYSK